MFLPPAAHTDHETSSMRHQCIRSWGAHSLCLALPATSVRFTGLSGPQFNSLKKSYQGFIAPQQQSDANTIECRVYQLDHSPTLPGQSLTRDGQYTPQKLLWPNKKGFQLTGVNFEAQIGLTPSHRLARLAVVKEHELAQPNVVENFLRFFAAHRTLQQRGLVLHSAGLVFDGQAYIFSGRSNAGKTTLTRKAYKHGARVLSDDINLLLPGKDGYLAHAVPFTGEFGHTLDHSGGQGAYPVAGIILLEQGENLTVETVTTADAVATLLTGCPFVNTDAEESSRLFDAVINLVATLPVIRLISSRDDSIEGIMAAVTNKFQSVTG